MVHIFVVFFLYSICTSILFIHHFYLYAWFVAVWGLFLCGYRLFFHYKRPLIILIIFCLFFYLIFLYILDKTDALEEKYYTGFVEQIDMRGKIYKFPLYKFSNNQYIVLLENKITNVLIYTHPYQKLSYLDQIEFEGKLHDIRDGEHELALYYKNINVQYVIFYPKILNHTFSKPENLYEKIIFNLSLIKSHVRFSIL